MSLSSLIRRSVVIEGLENRVLLSGVPASLTLHEKVGEPFTAVLGSFAASVPISDTATIAWGDGTTSQGRLVTAAATAGSPANTLLVLIDGTHTYTAADTYTINVNVFGNGAADPFLHITDEADVTAAVGPGGVTIDERAHQPFTAIVGSFNTSGAVPATGLSAIIAWGDGSSSIGKVVPSSTGAASFALSVQGSHTYVAAGLDDITVTVVKAGPGLTGAGSTATVLIASIDSQAIVSPAIGPGGVLITEAAGRSFTTAVGSFDAPVPATNYSAVIDWGDGTTSVGKLIPSSVTGLDTVSLSVVGSHDYAKGGIYDITVSVFNKLVESPTSAPFLTIDSEAVVVSPIAVWDGLNGTGAATLGDLSGGISASGLVDLTSVWAD